MRSKPGLVIGCLASSAALLLGVGSALAGPAANHQNGGTCKYKFKSGKAPGTWKGPVACSKPAGKGTATGAYTVSSGPKGSATLKGTYSDKFKQGTISGKFSVTNAPPSTDYTGTFKILKAAGKLNTAHGHGTMTCALNLAGSSFNCTQKLTQGKL